MLDICLLRPDLSFSQVDRFVKCAASFQVSKKVEEVDIVVKSILEKVVKLRAAHEERTKTIRELTGDIEQLERERTALLDSVAEKMGILEPKHKQVKVQTTAFML